jgi:exodeoxyribonuclease VII large subunit
MDDFTEVSYGHELEFSPTDFVAVVNQVFETAVPRVAIIGEVSNYKVSRNQWVYFDIKDESASLKCFMTIYQLSVPIEDGMKVRIVATPKLHPLYNFSLTVEAILPVGEGSIKKSTDLLEAKMRAEGLFDESRKRSLPFAPETICLIASRESAAYGDFIKVSASRWGNARIVHEEVRVQGDSAAKEIIAAIARQNSSLEVPEVLVITRGGGSADDLLVFQDEQLVRAIAASRIPTLVAIGHERDISLAELAADVRASTPSNAAELLFPSLSEERQDLLYMQEALLSQLSRKISDEEQRLGRILDEIRHIYIASVQGEINWLQSQKVLLDARDPRTILRRGYAQIRQGSKIVKSVKDIEKGDELSVGMIDGQVVVSVKDVVV